ncbi:lipoprotein [Mesoplasma melaleucae]|uniref:Lipoprotein n=1 Tax=Mesoplasma melaleucae TaxID=81459 RepID=A0A2K8NVI7_9MOLU|nr:lipoprotein [Mesoplasma melaleucae]ATZ17850.1 hypothetical protein EMELA_v1c02770 [Mesoplasma melaleucae]
MKKLLSLIGALSLTASATSVLISCSNNNDDKYGDTFINDSGGLTITTKDLLNWYNDTYGRLGKDPHKTLVEFYNIFAVAIYEEASKDNNIFKGIAADSSEYLNESGEKLAETLKTDYGKDSKAPNTIYGRANNAMISARKTYLDGKKQSTKAWIKYLRGQYPWVNNDQKLLENAWISNYILTNSSNSAYANLSKTLGFGTTDSTWAKGYLSIKVNDTEISRLLSEFLTANADTVINGKLDEKVTAQATVDNKKITSIINLINALGGKNAFGQTTSKFTIEFIENTNDAFLDTLTWRTFLSGISATFANNPESNAAKGTVSQISVANNNIFKITDVQGIKLSSEIYKDFYNYNARPASELNKTQLVSIAPTLNENKETQKTNILSNYQRFLVDKYFDTKKPVATSEIVLEFSKINANATPDINKEISPAQFVDTSKVTNDLIRYFEGFSQFYNLYVLNNDNASGGGSTKAKAETSTTTGLTDFETFYRGSNAPNGTNGISSDGRLWKMGANSSYITPYLTAKKNDKLLTLDYDTASGTYSNLAKYSVYDFLTTTPEEYKPSTESTWTSENTNIVSGWHNFDQTVQRFTVEAKIGMNELFNLVTDLGRLAEAEQKNGEAAAVKKPYKVLNAKDGIIAFIDTDGLHFMKIDGYSLLQSQSTEKATVQTAEQDKQQSIAYDLLSNTNKELIPYLLNPKLTVESGGKTSNYLAEGESTPSTPEESINNDISKSNIINNLGTTFGNDYSKILNYSVTNDYERFLVNNTIAKGLLTSDTDKSYLFYNYDILADAKAAVSTTESFGMLGQWLWTYLDEIFGTNGNYTQLFEKFFATDNSVDAKATAELISVIKNQQQKITDLRTNYEIKNNDWVTSTERNYKKQMKDLEKTPNAQKFIPNYALKADIDSLDKSAIWKTLVSKAKETIFVYNLPSSYLTYEIIVNNLNKHEGGVK